MQKPFSITPEMEADINEELANLAPSSGNVVYTAKPEPAPTPTTPVPEIEHSAFPVFTRGTNERTLITFVETEGYPILRISTGGNSQDLILNSDQVKLLLRQMTLWLTR